MSAVLTEVSAIVEPLPAPVRPTRVHATKTRMSALARCPNLERTCALAYALRSESAPCGLLAASLFAKSGTQGKRSELDGWMLDDPEKRPSPESWRLRSWTHISDEIVERVWAKRSWLLGDVAPGLKRHRDRSWLARALFAARERDLELATTLRYAVLELESESRALVVGKPKDTASVVERIDDADMRLYGLTPLGLREEGFGAFFARVLFLLELSYVSHRLSGAEHAAAWAAAADRLESPHPVGETHEVGRWLIRNVRSAIRNHDKLDRSLRKTDPHTAARAMIVRITRGARGKWPWLSHDEPFPSLDLDVVAGAVLQVLTIVSQRRKNQGRSAAEHDWFQRSPKTYEDAAKIVLEVSSVRDPASADHGATLFENTRALVRATMGRSSASDREKIGEAFGVRSSELERIMGEARARLPDFMSWLSDAIDELATKQEERARW